MSAYGKAFSTRLFIQAAFTGVLAPMSSHGSTWLMVTFVIAAGAAGVGAVIRNGHARTRELVIGFEALAVAVGVIGILGHHYIPGTIVGIAALITAVQHPAPAAAGPAPTAPASNPAFAAPPTYAPVVEAAAPMPMAAPGPMPVAAPPPTADVPVTSAPADPRPTPRTMNILPDG